LIPVFWNRNENKSAAKSRSIDQKFSVWMPGSGQWPGESRQVAGFQLRVFSKEQARCEASCLKTEN
jgi:hypothetical protein